MRERRDNKGRILRRGEQQRKDGSYMYTVLDPVTKKRKFIYSWKLERHDKMPAGKKPDLSLREKIKLLERDLANGISLSGGDMTVLELVENCVFIKTFPKESHPSRTAFKYIPSSKSSNTTGVVVGISPSTPVFGAANTVNVIAAAQSNPIIFFIFYPFICYVK